jgi:hypothetical protein
MSSSCRCRICNEPTDCDELLCPRCEADYADEIYSCPDGHCHVDLNKIAQRIRRIRENKVTREQ